MRICNDNRQQTTVSDAYIMYIYIYIILKLCTTCSITFKEIYLPYRTALNSLSQFLWVFNKTFINISAVS
jgi:uncharacterized protein (UPF0212 family)